MRRVNYKQIKEMELNSAKRIFKALSRTNSYLVSVLIELFSKGVNEREACDKLSMNYKLYRYTISKPELKHVVAMFNKARDYKATLQHETTIRKTTRAFKHPKSREENSK